MIMPRKKNPPNHSKRKTAAQTRKVVGEAGNFTKSRLTDEIRQSIFVREYARHGNGTKAAISAGYSPNCAKEQAYTLLTRTHIKSAIYALQRARRKRLEISADRIALELFMIATSRITDIGEIINGKFHLCDTTALDDTDIAAIAEVIETVTENPKAGTKTTRTHVKLYNRLDALKELNRMLGIGQDMNTLISGLRAYGLNIVQEPDGTYRLIDERVQPIEVEVDES